MQRQSCMSVANVEAGRMEIDCTHKPEDGPSTALQQSGKW